MHRYLQLCTVFQGGACFGVVSLVLVIVPEFVPSSHVREGSFAPSIRSFFFCQKDMRDEQSINIKKKAYSSTT